MKTYYYNQYVYMFKNKNKNISLLNSLNRASNNYILINVS